MYSPDVMIFGFCDPLVYVCMCISYNFIILCFVAASVCIIVY